MSDATQVPEELPEGEFPGTNIQPVKDGVEPVSQDPGFFDDGEDEF